MAAKRTEERIERIFHLSMKNQLGLILFVTLLLPACTSSPLKTLLTITPTAKCINETWSYFESATTEIKISPDLKITLREQTADLNRQEISETQTVIHGDGRVVYDLQSRGSTDREIHHEKQISAGQLQQIVDLFEAANFYAISLGCNGRSIYAMDTDTLDITVETKDRIHAIQDNGNCAPPGHYSFQNYCELDHQVQAILGTWAP